MGKLLLEATSILESISAFIKSMTDDDDFQVFLKAKLRKNAMKIQIPDDDHITALAKMQDGFAVGLNSGQVILVSPPSWLTFRIHDEPVIGLFAASSYFIAVAAQSSVKIWTVQHEQLESELKSDSKIVCLAGNILKELLFIGLENGVIEQHFIKSKERCELALKHRLHKEGEDSAAYVIKTNDSTTWIAARYASNALILWDHMNGSMLYHIIFSANVGLPSTWGLGETINISKFFIPEQAWEVFPGYIILSSPLVIRMSGSHISKISNSKITGEADDRVWRAMGKNLRKGHISTLSTDTLITFTKPNAKKKKSSKKQMKEVEIDLGLDFSMAERSEANNYLAFACGNTLEIVCLAAIETEFAHSIAGPVHSTQSHGLLFSRFHTLRTPDNKELLPLGLKERVLTISPNCEWATTTSDDLKSDDCLTFRIRNLQNSAISRTIPKNWTQGKFVDSCFSHDSKHAAILQTNRVIRFVLDSDEAFAIQAQVEHEARVTFSQLGVLLVAGLQRIYIWNVVEETYMSVDWEFQRVCCLPLSPDPSEHLLAYSKSRTSFCDLTPDGLLQSTTIAQGFDMVKSFNKTHDAVGSDDSGTLVFSIPGLIKLLHIKSGYQVIVSNANPILYAFCSDTRSASYGLIDVWDLKLGLKLQTTDSGLRHVTGNKLVVRSHRLGKEPKMKNITVQDTGSALLRGSWIIDLARLAATNYSVAQESKHQVKEMGLLEEHFELHCITWKKLSALLTVGEMHDDLIHVLIQPFHLNILHLLANNSQAHLLAKALHLGVPVIKSAFGSPMTLCLDRKSRKCLNVLLNGLILLKDTSPTEFLSALYHIRDDLFKIVSFGSSALAEFLNLVLVPLPEEMFANTLIRPRFTLPTLYLSDNLWVDPYHYQVLDAAEDEKLTVEYLICPFSVHMELGSKKSIRALKTLTASVKDMDIFNTLFVRTIINMKWDKLWPIIFGLTICYWGLLVALIARMFRYGDQEMVISAYIILNTWFFLIELLQASTAFKEYISEVWNYVDIGRILLNYFWVLLEAENWLTFLVVVLSLFRGITSFETFDATRFYVRMIFVVTQETLSFIWVFFYSTLSFGLIFAAVQPERFPGFFAAWMIPYELNMGSFDVEGKGSWYWMVFMVAALVNVVIMLNLVVSILGDAFEKFRSVAAAADVLEKAEIIYEYELVMWWRRRSGRRKLLQICRDEDSTKTGDMWTGKIEELKKELKKVERKLTSKTRIKKGLEKNKEDKTHFSLKEMSDLFDEKTAELKRDLKKLMEDRKSV